MDKTDGWIIVSILVGLYFGLFAKPKRVSSKKLNETGSK